MALRVQDEQGRARVFRLACASALALALSAPASSLAAETYVDRTDGTGGANDCTHKSNPCSSLTKGIANAGSGDTVFVGGDPHVYESPHTLSDGKSLVKKNFSTTAGVDTTGKAILDSGATALPTVHVTGAAGEVKGFTIRSEFLPMRLEADATVTGNTFDESAAISTQKEIEIDAGSAKVLDNTLSDPTPDSGEGITVGGSSSPTIKRDTLKGFYIAVRVNDPASPTIMDNNISRSHAFSSQGFGVYAAGTGKPEIVGNHLHGPVISGGDTLFGVFLGGSDGALSRNRIVGYSEGVRLDSTPGPIQLDSDVILGSRAVGIDANDAGSNDPGISDLKATNVTVFGSIGSEIGGTSTILDLNSSIVGPGGILAFGAGSCSIHHSRGPVQVSGGQGCQDFQTTKNPRFESDGYHLKSSSTMIDKGSRAKPPNGAKDIDGQTRALDGPDGGNCNGGKRRDIGADEYKCPKQHHHHHHHHHHHPHG